MAGVPSWVKGSDTVAVFFLIKQGFEVRRPEDMRFQPLACSSVLGLMLLLLLGTAA